MRYLVQFGQDKPPRRIETLPTDITELQLGEWKYSFIEKGGLGGWVGWDLCYGNEELQFKLNSDLYWNRVNR